MCLLLILTQGLKGNRLAPGKARSHPDCAVHCIRKFQTFPPNIVSRKEHMLSLSAEVHLTERGTADTDGKKPKIISLPSQRVREFQVCFRRGWGGSLDNKCI